MTIPFEDGPGRLRPARVDPADRRQLEESPVSLRRVAGVLLHTPSLRAAELARGGDPDEVNRAIETVFGVKVDA